MFVQSDAARDPASSTRGERVKLGEIVEVQHGFPFEGEHLTEWTAGMPVVVAIGNFRYEGGFRFEDTLTKGYRSTYPESFILCPEDIVVVMTCQTAGGEILGVPARVPNDGRTYLHNQRIGRLRIKDQSRLDENYLYYLLLSSRFNRYLATTATGTKILHTSPKTIHLFETTLPHLVEQQRIGSALRALDDKIQLNLAITKNFLDLSRALFQMRGPREGKASSTVGAELDVTMGQSPPGDSYNFVQQGHQFFQGCSDFGTLFPTERVYCKLPRKLARPGDILISVRAPVGRLNIALAECCIGRGLAALRHKSGSTALTFLYLDKLLETLKSFESQGTVFGSITKSELEQIPVEPLRPEWLLKMARNVDPVFRLIESLHRENVELARTRQGLLHHFIQQVERDDE